MFSNKPIRNLEIENYTGIDSVQILIPKESVLFQEFGKMPFQIERSKNSKYDLHTGFIGGIRITKSTNPHKSHYFGLQFSISSLFNGNNLCSDTPLNMNLILSLLNNKLNNAGVKIENLNGAKLARLDIFRNLILEEKYSKYFSILSLLHFPRTKKTIRYGSSVYYKNPGKRASFEAIVYDKAEQLKSLSNYDSVGPENILRMEFRYYGTRWISEQFKKFVFFYKFLDPKFPYFTYLENFDCDKFFRSKANKLLKPILNFDHLPSSTSLQNELEIFFKGKNSSNPRKEALLARTLLKMNEKGLLEEFIRRNEFKIMRLSFKSGTSQSRRKRIKERAYNLLITAGLMKEIILHGYNHMNELKQGLLEKRKNPRKRAA